MHPRPQKGSVTLVALCCITVLGIALASYLAVSNQAMKLSNRDYAKDVSRHLAEMGLERALRSFTDGTYGSWTHPDATTATRTIAIAGTNYSNRFTTAEANVRVDRYAAAVWSPATSYAVNDMAWYRGVWFHCTASNGPATAFNLANWTSAPDAWNADANYNVDDLVVTGGSAYRCILAHNNQAPPNATYWTASSVAAWNPATTYAVNDVALLGGTAYRCISGHTNHTPPNLTYWISAPVIYSEGVATLADSGSAPIKTQLRATIVPAPLFPNALGATTLVNLPSTGSIDSYNSSYVTAWNAGTTYNAGNLVYYSTTGFTYRYINAASTSGNLPTNTTYWSTAMAGSSAIVAGGTNAANAVTLTSARLNGYVAAPSAATSPYAPVWTYGGSAILTSTVPPAAPPSNIDLTRVSRSPYIPQFDIQAVTGATTLTLNAGANTNIGTVGATTPSKYVIAGDLYLDQSGETLTINGPVILDVQGQLYVYNNTTNSGGARIIIKPTGSAEIHFSGRMYVGSSVGTYDGIENQTYDPKKCILIGTSTANLSNSHYYWSTLPFYGVIYMPNAYVSTWNNVVVYGAISAKNIAFPNAGGVLHYDTSLRTAASSGVDAPFMIRQWRELTDPSEKIALP